MSVVRGVHAVREALLAEPRRIRKVALAAGKLDARRQEIVALARDNGIAVYRESRDRVGPSGVWAELMAFEWTDLDVIVESAPPPALLLVLDEISDPRNFGAVVRAADGAGVHGIVVPERRSAPPSEVAIQASAGALHHARVARVRNVADTLQDLKKAGIWTVGLSPTARLPWHAFDFTEPVAVVLGSEGKGLRKRVAASCDELVSLPQLGRVESLNLSVAAGVVLYETVRQRKRI